MTENEIKVLRANIVCGMDTYIREVIGDEEVTEYWLTYGMPDGSDEDSIMYDMADDDIFEEWVAAFKHCLYADRMNREED